MSCVKGLVGSRSAWGLRRGGHHPCAGLGRWLRRRCRDRQKQCRLEAKRPVKSPLRSVIRVRYEVLTLGAELKAVPETQESQIIMIVLMHYFKINHCIGQKFFGFFLQAMLWKNSKEFLTTQ